MKKIFLSLNILFLGCSANAQNIVCNKSFNQNNFSKKIILHDGEALIFERNCYDTVAIIKSDGTSETKLTERLTGKPILLNNSKIIEENDSDNMRFFIHADSILNETIYSIEREHDKDIFNGHYNFQINNIVVNQHGKVVFHDKIIFKQDAEKNVQPSKDFDKIATSLIAQINRAFHKMAFPILENKGKKYPYLISIKQDFNIGK